MNTANSCVQRPQQQQHQQKFDVFSNQPSYFDVGQPAPHFTGVEIQNNISDNATDNRHAFNSDTLDDIENSMFNSKNHLTGHHNHHPSQYGTFGASKNYR
jgi:hypothetical protein